MRLCFLIAGLLAGSASQLAAAPLASRQAEMSIEYAVKAAYLTKFIPFISWPEPAFSGAGAPVTICVLGGNPFGSQLEKAAGTSRLAERAIAVRYLAGPDPDASCHLLFIGRGDPTMMDGTLDAMRGRPVVTVTDSGARSRGVIAFVVANNSVRFDIDDSLAAEGGLSISSKLLSLARTVKQRGQP